MLLEIKDVEVVYNNVILALKGVNLDMGEGMVVTILGANGAGKSTILKAIAGIIQMENGRIRRGEIHFDGQRLDGKDPAEIARSKISLVMEGREIFRSLTVEENLKVGSLIRKDDRKKIRDDLELILNFFPHLRQRQGQIAGTLSGGEQQMLVISMALMTQPKLLLLDEPSLGLAPIVAQLVFEQIENINKNLGTSILVVEQNASLSLPISQTFFVITNGMVVHSGIASAIKDVRDISHYYLGNVSVGGAPQRN